VRLVPGNDHVSVAWAVRGRLNVRTVRIRIRPRIFLFIWSYLTRGVGLCALKKNGDERQAHQVQNQMKLPLKSVTVPSSSESWSIPSWLESTPYWTAAVNV